MDSIFGCVSFSLSMPGDGNVKSLIKALSILYLYIFSSTYCQKGKFQIDRYILKLY